MGCITGLVAKIFLTAFNIVVALTGAAVLALAAVVAYHANRFEDLIPKEVNHMLNALQSISPIVMCLGLFGVLVACCCSNKLFLYTYFIMGCCLVVATLTAGGIGTSNINNGQYENDIKTLMYEDIQTYNLSNRGDYEKNRDEIYHENECCGVISYKDWETERPFNKRLPPGCCLEYPIVTDCTTGDSADVVHVRGCYTTLEGDVGEIAAAAVRLAIFFGVLLFALLASTCLCVKCTDAMPI